MTDQEETDLDTATLPPIMTVQELANFLRVRPNLIYSMYRRGQLPGGKRLGRTIRFSTKVVLEWLQGEDAGNKKKVSSYHADKPMVSEGWGESLSRTHTEE